LEIIHFAENHIIENHTDAEKIRVHFKKCTGGVLKFLPMHPMACGTRSIKG
jgi:hypothetical protein